MTENCGTSTALFATDEKAFFAEIEALLRASPPGGRPMPLVSSYPGGKGGSHHTFFGHTRKERRLTRYAKVRHAMWVLTADMTCFDPSFKPNTFVTVHLDLDRILEKAPTRTVSSYRYQMMDNVSRLFRHEDEQFEAIWVIEIDGGKGPLGQPHVHMLCRLPTDRTLRRNIARTMWKASGKPVPPANRILAEVASKGSGAPVNFTPLGSHVFYRASGRSGKFGCVDYMSKSIEETMLYRALPYRIGKVWGIWRSAPL